MRIEKKKEIVEIQEEVRIPQGNQEIILEKGDRIEVLKEKANWSSTKEIIENGLKYGLELTYLDPKELRNDGAQLAENLLLAFSIMLEEYLEDNDGTEDLTRGAYTDNLTSDDLVVYLVQGMIPVLEKSSDYYRS